MYFASYRPDGVGGSDIYAATRSSVDDPWLTVENVGTRVNTTASEWGPCISADGLKLYFSSDRADGYGGQDLWVATRPSLQSQWSPARNLGSTVNTGHDEIEPSISTDELTLYYCNGLNVGPPDGLQIWVARRATPEGTWSEPENLDPYIDVGVEACPCISADDLTLLYAGAPGLYGTWALYAARRATTAEPFGLPVMLDMGISQLEWISPVMPGLSADGETLYFAAGNIDNGTGWNIWEVELSPIVDLNGDGRVDGLELARMAANWGGSDIRYDIAPMPSGNGVVDAGDAAILAEYAAMDDIGDPTLVGRWKLDGNPDEPGMACDCSQNCCHGILMRGACLLPDCGIIDGALQCDGKNDYVMLPTTFSPGDGAFSVFAWVNGTAQAVSGAGRGKVILSQQWGANWLMADGTNGGLQTELRSDARFTSALQSDTCICDDSWHEVGLVWDGTNRTLYVDGVAVARDTQANIAHCRDCLQLGASENRRGNYWRGLIDEVRIYSRAVEP